MSRRLAGYDYRQPGFYFVTLCIEQRRPVFGSIANGQVSLRRPGQIAETLWVSLPRRFSHVKLDAYVFMPNHMHGIIQLTEIDPTSTEPRAPLGEIVRTFKAVTAYQIRHGEGTPWFAWQADYYETVIRSETALQQVRHYISENPLRWTQDELYRR